MTPLQTRVMMTADCTVLATVSCRTAATQLKELTVLKLERVGLASAVHTCSQHDMPAYSRHTSQGCQAGCACSFGAVHRTAQHIA